MLELKGKHLSEASTVGGTDILSDLVFPSPEGSILDPDNLYHRYFQRVLAASGLRRIRFHDLRHTFGSLLIQSGASIVYVKEQMGHSSIQVTVDTYGHLMPGANVSFVDRLDEISKQNEGTTPHQSAPGAHQTVQDVKEAKEQHDPKIVDFIPNLNGGGGWTRTNDLRIMRPSL